MAHLKYQSALDITTRLPVRLGAYGVVVNEGRLPLCHGRWKDKYIINLPGGGVSIGEDPVAALEREFQEELGIAPSVGKLLYTSIDGIFVSSPGFPKARLVYSYFAVRYRDGCKLAGNHNDVEEARWYSLSALPFESMLEVDKHFCRNYLVPRR